jgi:hypothetical protein
MQLIENRHTLMVDLEDGPEYLMPLLAFVRSILGVFHFIAEFQQRVFDVLKAIGWGFAIAGCADRWHISRDGSRKE